MATYGDARSWGVRATLAGTTAAVFLLQLPCVVTGGEAAHSEVKALAKPHPHLVSTPPLTEEDFRVFVALHTPCTFEMKKTPLGDLARQLSEQVKVEVKVDGDGLRRAKPKPIDENVQFTTKQENKPLQSILWEILPPAGLDYRVHQGRLVITSSFRCQRNLVTWTFPVADLCANNKDYDNLVKQVYSTLPGDTWENMGGPATLQLDKPGRRFTMIYTQSSLDRVLELLTERRRDAKKAQP